MSWKFNHKKINKVLTFSDYGWAIFCWSTISLWVMEETFTYRKKQCVYTFEWKTIRDMKCDFWGRHMYHWSDCIRKINITNDSQSIKQTTTENIPFFFVKRKNYLCFLNLWFWQVIRYPVISAAISTDDIVFLCFAFFTGGLQGTMFSQILRFHWGRNS